MSNSLTDWSYCMQGNHSVPKDEMTCVRANGVKRRMCTKCASRWNDDKKKRNGHLRSTTIKEG